MTAARALAILPIRAYQRLVAPAVGARCKYYPSCSEYAARAVQEFGILRGLILAGWSTVDAQNNRTTVSLSGQRFNVPVADSAFSYRPIQRRGPRR